MRENSNRNGRCRPNPVAPRIQLKIHAACEDVGKELSRKDAKAQSSQRKTEFLCVPCGFAPLREVSNRNGRCCPNPVAPRIQLKIHVACEDVGKELSRKDAKAQSSQRRSRSLCVLGETEGVYCPPLKRCSSVLSRSR
ncbi:hypothetical protein SBA3_2760035 [Candidatus Sulfopaludibacter sp. SbA3]|nr:hypothetical protein SBA3_2760035 [Candidatus Sulfopaludibacter sp. SbA3]